MVTVSTNQKIFSTGFNLQFLTKVKEAAIQLVVAVLKLYDRVLTFPMATLAITQGHTFAGGLLLALVHDRRIALNDTGKWCLSEIQLGISVFGGYASILKHLLPPHLSREIFWGGKYTPKILMKERVIHNVYSTDEELQQIVAQTCKTMGAVGHFREVVHDTKLSLNADLHKEFTKGKVPLVVY